jgi:VanZ family protein
MTIIFLGSTDLLSTGRTSRIIGPVLRWFNPNVSDEAIRRAQYVIRKCGHVSEYAILAVLLWRALGTANPNSPGWNWRRAGAALAIAILYAVTDELHQARVPTRLGSSLDVMIDTAGAALGLTLVRATRHRRSSA